MNFLLCQNAIVHICLNNAQDNEGSAAWARGSFDSIIRNSFNIKDIHQVNVSKDTPTDVILCCLHWWRKQRRQQNTFLFTLSSATQVFQWSNLVSSRTILEIPRSELTGQKALLTQVPLYPDSWDFISEGDDLRCPFAHTFTTSYSFLVLTSNFYSLLYHVLSLLWGASLANTKTFKGLQPS